jgi:transcriptional regulator GlxA family with amidase domain
MAKMVFLAVEGCLSSSIGSLVDAFSIANRWHRALAGTSDTPPFETRIVSADGRPILANGNIAVHPDGAMTQVDQAEVILLPAFPQMIDPQAPNIKETLAWLRDRHARGITLAAMCTGAFLLAESGLLDGKSATTHWQFSKLFQRRFPKVRFRLNRILTEEDGLITTGASTAVFNLGLHLIRRFGSEELATLCSRAFLVDPHRATQAPYAVFHPAKNHGDGQILKAQEWMDLHYARRIVIDAIAKMVGISPRHFKRRFRKATGESPLAYLQHLRIEAAKKKLATSRARVNEITYLIGYEDSSTFRRLFKKQVGISPREYRDKFLAGRKAA